MGRSVYRTGTGDRGITSSRIPRRFFDSSHITVSDPQKFGWLWMGGTVDTGYGAGNLFKKIVVTLVTPYYAPVMDTTLSTSKVGALRCISYLASMSEKWVRPSSTSNRYRIFFHENGKKEAMCHKVTF